MALFLPVAAAGIHGSNNCHKRILPLGLGNESSDTDPQCLALNTNDWSDSLRNSQTQTQADAIPQAWTHTEAAGGLPWGSAVAGGSRGRLAIDGTSRHCAKSEAQADDMRLSEGLGLDPGMVPWASHVAVVAAGEPKVPSLTLGISLLF